MGLFDQTDLGPGAYAPKAPAIPNYYNLFKQALDGVDADQQEEMNHLLDKANSQATIPVKRQFARPLAQGETYNPDTDISISDAGPQPQAPPTIGRMYDQGPPTPFVDSPEQVAKDVADWKAMRAANVQHPAPEESPLVAGLKGAGEGLLNVVPFLRSRIVSPVEAAQGPVPMNGVAKVGDLASDFIGGASEGTLGALGGGLVSGGNPIGAAAGMAAAGGYSSLAESAEQHRIDAMHQAEQQAANAPLFQPGTQTPAPIPQNVDTSLSGGFKNLTGPDYGMAAINALIGGLGGHLGTKATQQAVYNIAQKAGAGELTDAALKALTRTELGKAALKQLGFDVGSGVVAGGAGLAMDKKPTSYDDLKSMLTLDNAKTLSKQALLNAGFSLGGQAVGFRHGIKDAKEAGSGIQAMQNAGVPAEDIQAAVDRYKPANIEAARKADTGPGLLTRVQAAKRDLMAKRAAEKAQPVESEQVGPEIPVGTDTGNTPDIQTKTLPDVGKPMEQLPELMEQPAKPIEQTPQIPAPVEAPKPEVVQPVTQKAAKPAPVEAPKAETPAPAPASEDKPLAVKEAQAIQKPTKSGKAMTYGNETKVVLDSGEAFPAVYVLHEHGDAIPSHSALSGFQENPEYTAGTKYQMKDTARTPEAMTAANVLANKRAASYDPAQDINNSQSIERSMRVIDPNNDVIAGNNRSAMKELVNANHPEKAAAAKQYLRDNAEKFGISPEDVDKYQNPDISRLLLHQPQGEKSIALANASNAPGTMGMNTREQASAVHKVVSQKDPALIHDMLRDADSDGAQTMSELMNHPNVQDRFIKAISGDFATELPRMLDDGKLNATGKDLFKKVVMHDVFSKAPDGDALSRYVANADPVVGRKIENALYQVARINGDKGLDGKWKLNDSLPEAVRFLRDTEEQRAGGAKSLTELIQQPDMFSGETHLPSKKAQELLLALDRGANNLRDTLKSYYAQAKGDEMGLASDVNDPVSVLRSIREGTVEKGKNYAKPAAQGALFSGVDLGAGTVGDKMRAEAEAKAKAPEPVAEPVKEVAPAKKKPRARPAEKPITKTEAAKRQRAKAKKLDKTVTHEDETSYNRSLSPSKEGPPFERKVTKQPELPKTPPKKPPVEQSDADSVEVKVPGKDEPTVLRRLDPVALHAMAKSLVDEIKLFGPGKTMSKMAQGVAGYIKVLKKKAGLELGIRHDLIRKEGYDKFNAVLAHEIGHAVDWGRDVAGKAGKVLSARGNVLGHIFALHKYLGDTFNMKPMEAGGHNNDVIHNELVKLSEHWNPYDKAEAKRTDPSFIEYRESPKELYADFISAVLNDPATAYEKAPHAVQAFVEAMANRPEFEKTYNELMSDMAKAPEELASQRVGKMQSAFKRGESELERQHAAREEYKEKLKPNWKENYIDKFGFLDRVAKKAAEGSSGYKALHHAIELVERMQFPYRAMKVKEAHEKALSALREGYGDTEEALDQARSDAGAYIALNRIAKGDRADLVNPYNFQPRIAADTWEGYKKSLSPEQAKAVEKAVGHLSDMTRKNLKERYEAGLLSKENYARFTEDDKDKFYGTFRTLDHAKIDETPGFEPQHGTDKEIANPFTITFMKLERSAQQITEQHAKNATIEALGMMGQIKKVPPEGKAGPNDKGLIVGFDDGKATRYEVNPVLARAFREFRLPVEHGQIANAFGAMNDATKAAYITYSMPFSAQQIPKDAIQALGLLPKQVRHTGPLGVVKDAFSILHAMGMGFADAKRYAQGKSSEDLENLYRLGVLEPDNPSPFTGTQRKYGTEMLRNEGIIGPEKKGRVDVVVSKIPYMSKLLDVLYKVSSGAEVHSKIYMYKMLKNSGMPEESISALLRNGVGTPNFRRSGFQTQQMGRLFQFGNVAVQGIKFLHDISKGRSGIEGMEKSYMAKRLGGVAASLAVANAVPILAQMGVFGDDTKEAYNKISDYDNGTHLCIFHGWRTTKDGGREPKYWRMPLPEIFQVPKNMMYQAAIGALRGNGAADRLGESLLDGVVAMAGALPGLSSSVKTALNFGLILGNGKGFDSFRNQDILNDTDMKLGMGHRLWKFGKYAAGQLGGESLNPINVPGRFLKGEPLFGTAHDSAPIPQDVRTEKKRSDEAAAERTLARQKAIAAAKEAGNAKPISDALNKGLITRNQALSARREFQQTSLQRFTKGMDPARRQQILKQYEGNGK